MFCRRAIIKYRNLSINFTELFASFDCVLGNNVDDGLLISLVVTCDQQRTRCRISDTHRSAALYRMAALSVSPCSSVLQQLRDTHQRRYISRVRFDHISGRDRLIDFIFDFIVGFTGTTERMDLLLFAQNPRWRPATILEISNDNISGTDHPINFGLILGVYC